MDKTAELILDGKTCKLPIIEGSEHERAVDISSLRNETGYITLDDGYANTGSCQSQITFIDGEQGILRYRGIPIEELAEGSTFIEVAHLIIMGHLPNSAELRRFSDLLTDNELLNEAMKHHFEGFPANAHPDGHPLLDDQCRELFLSRTAHAPTRTTISRWRSARLLSQVRTIAAFAYRKSRGLPIIYPKPELKYTANFLHMLFCLPYQDYELKPEAVKALDLIFLLHADHEQNCSTATVRMVASSRANLFASAAAGVCALWGPLHGGANQAVLEMLEDIHQSGDDGSKFIAAAKDKNSGKRLMGFGHRVYKHYDPRAKIIKKACDDVLAKLHITDPAARHRQAPGGSGSARLLLRRAQALSQRGFLQRHHHARHRHSRWRCSPSCSPSAACRAGSPTTRKSWKPRRAFTGRARFTPATTLNHYVPIKERK